MEKRVIKIQYDSVSKRVFIESEEKLFNAECLTGLDISEWAYPFLLNNVRWNGIYDELKSFYTCTSFNVLFLGSDEDLSTLRQAFNGKPVNISGLNNKVVIIYDDVKLTTKITINGKIFDTAKLNGRSINEWVVPFPYCYAKWDGIFKEIENYLGTNSYSIKFIGKTDDMQILMNCCPENINITYKAPMPKQKKAALPVPQTPIKENHANQQITPEYKPQISATGINGKALAFSAEAKKEYAELKRIEPGIELFGKISVIIAALSFIIFVILMPIKFMVILAAVPAMIFSILIYTKGYKKLALATGIAVIVLTIIAVIIIKIRWNIAFKDFNDNMDETFDIMNDANEAINDAFNAANNAY